MEGEGGLILFGIPNYTKSLMVCQVFYGGITFAAFADRLQLGGIGGMFYQCLRVYRAAASLRFGRSRRVYHKGHVQNKLW